MNADDFLILRNLEPAAVSDVPVASVSAFRETLSAAVARGARLAALYGRRAPGGVRLTAVVAFDEAGLLGVVSADVGRAYPSLTPDCPQAHLFEREIAEEFAIMPEGHPWLKPVRFLHSGSGAGEGAGAAIGITDFFHMDGEEVHEVAVGPVHAGVIEPGHFRFQCHGENVYHLEISLGYQHRGVERALVGGPSPRTIHHMETLAGDTTAGHSLCYCQAVEALSGVEAPARAQVIRGIALELERLANHTGDLGALAGDVGYLPTASYCGRLRGDFLNMTALLCGNRFSRGLARPGGAAFDVEEARAAGLVERLDATRRDVASAVGLLWKTPSVLARFEEAGTISRETCDVLGLVGPAARACGAVRDTRYDFPSGVYRVSHIPVCTWHTGDVFARAYVRWLEIEGSAGFVRAQLSSLPAGPIMRAGTAMKPHAIVVSLVEGWRGGICHVAETDAEGRFARYKVVDPSFHNWTGLAMALRGQQISDFPLCNKSFNLSYCGHDL